MHYDKSVMRRRQAKLASAAAGTTECDLMEREERRSPSRKLREAAEEISIADLKRLNVNLGKRFRKEEEFNGQRQLRYLNADRS